MKKCGSLLALLFVLTVGTLVSCSSQQSPDVSEAVRTSLDQANLKDVSVNQDRDKGVVTLGGHVATEGDKTNAESIAKNLSGRQVVANEIAVLPPGGESDAKTINSELDEGIESNLKAALIQSKLEDGVDYQVKNGVVTLSGEVNSQARRTQTETVASAVPNVQQVVNELQVKNQKATSVP